MPQILDYSPNVKIERSGNFVDASDPKLHNLNNIDSDDYNQRLSTAQSMSVFVLTNHFNKSEKQYSNSIRLQLPFPTNDSIKIVKRALEGIRQIYRSGYRYKKTGIILYELNKSSEIGGLFDINKIQSNSIMKTIDKINYRYGSSAIKLASEGIKKNWPMKRESVSPRYTTRFDELIEVNC